MKVQAGAPPRHRTRCHFATTMAPPVIDLTLIDDGDKQTNGRQHKQSMVTIIPNKKARLATEDRQEWDADEENEVQVVDKPREEPKLTAVPSLSNDDADDDELKMIGTIGGVDLPHMRQHCTTYPFTKDHSLTCNKCYCYVCDVKVSECQQWSIHCHATDQGPCKQYWKEQRDIVKRANQSHLLRQSDKSHCEPPRPRTDDAEQPQFVNNDMHQAHDRRSTQVMQFRHPFTPRPGMVLLFQSKILFRIKCESYTEHPEWKGRPEEIKHKIFLFRLGNHPSLEIVCLSARSDRPSSTPYARFLVFEHHNLHRPLMDLLELTKSLGSDVLDPSIQAEWRKEECRGTLNLDIYIRLSCLDTSHRDYDRTMTITRVLNDLITD